MLILSQLETLKYSVDRAGSELEKARSESSHLTRWIKDNRNKWVGCIHTRACISTSTHVQIGDSPETA